MSDETKPAFDYGKPGGGTAPAGQPGTTTDTTPVNTPEEGATAQTDRVQSSTEPSSDGGPTPPNTNPSGRPDAVDTVDNGETAPAKGDDAEAPADATGAVEELDETDKGIDPDDDDAGDTTSDGNDRDPKTGNTIPTPGAFA